jgi:hypothetical protein
VILNIYIIKDKKMATTIVIDKTNIIEGLKKILELLTK